MKLLAVDLDQTLLLMKDKETTLRNIKAVKKFLKQGNTFALLTGRQYQTFKLFLKKFDLTCDYIVGEDGAVILDKEEKEIYRKNIKPETVEKILDISEFYGKNSTFDNGYEYHISSINNIVKIIIPKKEVVDDDNFFDDIKNIKDIKMYFSHNWLNISNKNIDKYKAVKFIEERGDIDKENIFVVGDGLTDYEMIKRYNGILLGQSQYDYLYQYVEELIDN